MRNKGVSYLKEERDDPMAVNKKETPKMTTVNDKSAMKSAQKVMEKYEKAFEKLAKN
jgi:hypothetical protein